MLIWRVWKIILLKKSILETGFINKSLFQLTEIIAKLS